jgi:cellulose synthase/poly-beta-1,6-N-acetylglucosamine synthase-like glycosyltransferase
LTRAPQLSVVVPVFNEQDNVGPLLREILVALRGRIDFEAIFVDDDSKDGTLAALQALKAEAPELRVLHHVRQSGQSTAVRTGVRPRVAGGSRRSTATARTIPPTFPSCSPHATPLRARSSCSPDGA